MGLTKTDNFTEQQNELANIAKALGHPARIAILQHLVNINSCICGELVLEIGLAQPTVSQHLTALKAVGIIQGNIEGTSVCYCINADTWKRYDSLFEAFFGSYKAPTTCC